MNALLAEAIVSPEDLLSAVMAGIGAALGIGFLMELRSLPKRRFSLNRFLLPGDRLMEGLTVEHAKYIAVRWDLRDSEIETLITNEEFRTLTEEQLTFLRLRDEGELLLVASSRKYLSQTVLIGVVFALTPLYLFREKMVHEPGLIATWAIGLVCGLVFVLGVHALTFIRSRLSKKSSSQSSHDGDSK